MSETGEQMKAQRRTQMQTHESLETIEPAFESVNSISWFNTDVYACFRNRATIR